MEKTEKMSNKKRLRSSSKEEKIIHENYGTVKLLLHNFTTTLFSIQSFKKIPNTKIYSLKTFKNSLLKEEKYQEYLRANGLEETEEDELPIIHKFGTIFSESELYGFLTICVIKLINSITEYKELPEHLSQLIKDLKKETSFSFVEQKDVIDCSKLDILLDELQLPSKPKEQILNQEESEKYKQQLHTYMSFLSFKPPLTPLFNEETAKNDSELLHYSRKEDILYILTSQPILECYKELFTLQGIQTTEELIKEEIIQYLKDSAHFLVSELASNTYGFTIYSGTVVINKQCFSKTLPETIQNCFAITTIIHEMANVLLRRMRTETNYYLNTKECFYNDVIFQESGQIVEMMLFGNFNSCTEPQSLFIRRKESYQSTKDVFKHKMIQLLINYPGSKEYKLKGRSGIIQYKRGECLFRWSRK